VLAPLIAAPIVTSLGGYPALYGAAAAAAVVSLVALGRIRTVI
jgi:hypothetical protein